MDLQKYIKVVDNILPFETVSSILKFANKELKENKFIDSLIGSGEGALNKEIRNVQHLNLNISSTSLTNVHYHNLLSKIFLEIAKEYIKDHPYVDKITEVIQLDILRYIEGGHYKYHVDDGHSFNRILSCILFLNNDYKNGDLCFKFEEQEVLIKPKPGKLIMWPSNFLFPHCVKPISKGVRFSIVSWMR